MDTNTPKLNFLVAYPYCKPDVFEVLKNQTLPYRFLLDSGAFTAHNAGKVITLDDYCRFIEAMPVKPWRYFQLDVVGDPDKTAGMEYPIRLLSPFMFKSKAQEWQMAEEVGGKTFVDFIVNETHTCYEGDHATRPAWGFGCGKCPACRLRAEGFKNYAEHR